MTFDEYYEHFCQMLLLDDDFKQVELEVELLPGESTEDAFIRFMLDNEYMVEYNDGYLYDMQKLREFDSNLAKIIEATVNAELYSTMDDLVEKGIVTQSIDEDGEAVWLLDQENASWLKDYLSE